MASPYTVFLSAVTSEFESARTAISSDLRARGLEGKFQDDFRQEAESDTTLRKLNNYIRDCSAVVALVGTRGGALPPPPAAEPFAAYLPPDVHEATYTQWEVFFALHHGRRLSIYVANDAYGPDQEEPNGNDHTELQSQFLAHIMDKQGLDRTHFSTVNEVRAEVLREDWPSIDLEPASDRKALRLVALGLLSWGAVVAIEFAYGSWRLGLLLLGATATLVGVRRWIGHWRNG